VVFQCLPKEKVWFFILWMRFFSSHSNLCNTTRVFMYIIHKWSLSFLVHFHLFFSFSWFQFVLGSHGLLVLTPKFEPSFHVLLFLDFSFPICAFISSDFFLDLNFVESYISRLPFHQMFFFSQISNLLDFIFDRLPFQQWDSQTSAFSRTFIALMYYK